MKIFCLETRLKCKIFGPFERRAEQSTGYQSLLNLDSISLLLLLFFFYVSLELTKKSTQIIQPQPAVQLLLLLLLNGF